MSDARRQQTMWLDDEGNEHGPGWDEPAIISVDTGYANFGLVVNGGTVIDAPPIARWTIGKPTHVVVDYYLTKKGAHIYD